MTAMGSLLSEAFGEMDNTKMRKKNKKKDKMEVVNPSHMEQAVRDNIKEFDSNFENSSNNIKSRK